MSPNGASRRFDYLFDLPKTVAKSLGSNPIVLVLFVGIAALLVGLDELVDQYAWEFTAIASRALPVLFERRYVFPPRAPYVTAAIGVFAAGVCWAFAVTCAASVTRIDAALRDRSMPAATAIRAGVASSHRVLAYLVVYSALTAVGLLAFVVPGLVVSIRLFVGLPAIVLEDRSVRGTIRESWRLTAGHEVGIGLVLAAHAIAAMWLSMLPAIGHVVAFVVVGSSGVVASVVTYERLA